MREISRNPTRQQPETSGETARKIPHGSPKPKKKTLQQVLQSIGNHYTVQGNGTDMYTEFYTETFSSPIRSRTESRTENGQSGDISPGSDMEESPDICTENRHENDENLHEIYTENRTETRYENDENFHEIYTEDRTENGRGLPEIYTANHTETGNNFHDLYTEYATENAVSFHGFDENGPVSSTDNEGSTAGNLSRSVGNVEDFDEDTGIFMDMSDVKQAIDESF